MRDALIGGALALLVAVPLAWKWQLGLRRVVVAMLLLTAAAGAMVAPFDFGTVLSPLAVTLVSLAAAVAILAHRFYRDPDRRAPAGRDLVVSPADGEVLYIREARGGELPVATKHGRHYRLEELTKTPLRSEHAVVVGIGMSFLDVHVNRAPIAGRVTLHRHFPGAFGSLRHPDMVFANERATTVIEGGQLEVAVVQIASRLVRQIAAFVREGEDVSLGQRIGVIRLGSQVDVVLPADAVQITVSPGDRIRAGESVLARLR